MITQLNPPIPIETPKGDAWAIAIIDYGPHWDLQWISFVHETGECWTFNNAQIRQSENYTFGLKKPSPIQKPYTNGHEINGHNGNIYVAAKPNGWDDGKETTNII